MTTLAKFSMFEAKLNPAAFSCFRVLFENVRDLLAAGKKTEGYEIPVASFFEKCNVDDLQTVADAIREIIQCRVEIKKGEYLYFYTFFNSVSIENGIVRYTLPPEVENVIPSAIIAANA
ncbi:MAG: hypothetical protein VB050_13425 [Geobacteraceae bacterium]|nr:hypothetical protein [Geobacteraceae bacterium]